MVEYRNIDRKIPMKIIMVETAMAANGGAVAGARLRTRHIPSTVIEGYSTNRTVADLVIQEIGGMNSTGYRIFLAELIGNFLSSEAYPFVYSEAWKSGIVNKDTKSIPMMGATLWTPMDSSSIPTRKGAPIIWGDKLIYSSPVAQAGQQGRPAHALSTLNGLMEFYNFENMSEQRAADQTKQVNTSRIPVTKNGELNSIVFAIWVRLGEADDRQSKTRDELVRRTPDLASKVGDTNSGAHFNSAQGYNQCARNWITPHVLLSLINI